MKSTEPFLDEYYMLDLEETMRQVGFVDVHSILTDPRHRTVTATVPTDWTMTYKPSHEPILNQSWPPIKTMLISIWLVVLVEQLWRHSNEPSNFCNYTWIYIFGNLEICQHDGWTKFTNAKGHAHHLIKDERSRWIATVVAKVVCIP
jgi:hypothetical protein